MRRLRTGGVHFGLIVLTLWTLSAAVWAAPNNSRWAGNARLEFVANFTMANYSNEEVRNISGGIPVMSWTKFPQYQQLDEVVSDPAVTWNNDGYQVGFNIERLPPGGVYRVLVRYKIRYSPLFQDPPNSPEPSDYTEGLESYLQPEGGVEVGDPMLKSVLVRIGAVVGTPKEKARKIFSFINQTLSYKLDFNRKADALVALQTGWGRCEDYAMLYVALCRTAGIPARLVIGFRLQPNEINENPVGLDDKGHMWAEIYLPSTGWISVDPTYLVLNRSGEKVTDYRFFAGFYDDDIHIFMHYGQEHPQIAYRSKQEHPDLRFRLNYYIRGTY